MMENEWCGLSRHLQVGRSAGGWQADGGQRRRFVRKRHGYIIH